MAKAAKVQTEGLSDRVTIETLEADEEVQVLLVAANEHLQRIGYTEHGTRHAGLVARIAYNVLDRLDYSARSAELASVAGYLHDIGNVIHRANHAQGGALMARSLLQRLGMPIDEVADVMGAVGNHEEERGDPVSEISAALIIADKSDVHRSRVQNPDILTFDIHDRVNYAAQRSFVRVDAKAKTITLELDVDTEISKVMEYFEIFTDRMLMSRRAVRYLGCEFALTINDTDMF
ncbi:MAG: HD domain-containing protein [Anaerolineae bacterium]